MDAYLTTSSGRRVDIPDPRKGQIVVEDIATHLSRIPRFVGGTSRVYSVAQHSIVVGYIGVAVRQYHSRTGSVPTDVGHLADADILREGLLHDGHEYLMGDCPSPVKRLLGSQYRQVEGSIDRAVRREFGLHGRIPFDVHTADQFAQMLEDLELRSGRMDFSRLLENLPLGKIEDNDWFQAAREMVGEDWTPDVAREAFLREWRLVGEG